MIKKINRLILQGFIKKSKYLILKKLSIGGRRKRGEIFVRGIYLRGGHLHAH